MPEAAALRWAPSPLESVARSRRIFNAVIERPCPACDAPAHLPCLTIEPGFPHSATCLAVCSERVERWKHRQRATGPNGPPGPRADYVDPGRMLERRHPNRHPMTTPKEPQR